MAVDKGQSPEVDLDNTDQLPILEGIEFDDDVEDDAVRMDYAAPSPSIKSDFPRPPSVDLPSLAQSVRSVEERIARQAAEYESLARSYDRAVEAEAVTAARAEALTAELADLRAALEAESSRSRDTGNALAEKVAAAEVTRARIEEALRDAERHRLESHTLRDTLAARDATIVQVLHSLGERDAQLGALQRDHAQMLPVLEERSRAGTQLEADLRTARSRTEAMAAELQAALHSVAQLTAQLKTGEHELDATQRELTVIKSQAVTYLEKLRTREWRHGFDDNMFRELDAQVGVAQAGQEVLHAERDALRQRVADVELKLAARDKSIAKLRSAAAADEARHVEYERKLQEMERSRGELADKLAAVEGERQELQESVAKQQQSIAVLQAAAATDDSLRRKQQHELEHLDGVRTELTRQIAVLEGEKTRLNAASTTKDLALEAALASGAAAVERINESLTDAEQARSDLLTRIETMQAEAQAREEQMNVLVAHLQEARRPIKAIENDLQRLTEELLTKSAALEALSEENRTLRLTVERTRGALEEREFLIRRLERSESNNANVLGRIQTSIERLGAASTAGAAALPECTAKLARIDGSHDASYTLSRRTRIGRSLGCELQIDSSSVSRNHALVLMGQRDVIIEDLNSTNGVLVNGRKVSRQLLKDGDIVIIGEAQFRFSLVLAPRALEPPAST